MHVQDLIFARHSTTGADMHERGLLTLTIQMEALLRQYLCH